MTEQSTIRYERTSPQVARITFDNPPVNLMGTWQVTATGSPGANPVRWRWRDLRPQINACPEPSTWMPWRREAGSGRVAGAG